MSDVKDTIRERQNLYGDFRRNAECTIALMAVVDEWWSGDEMDPAHREALHMIFHKISRMTVGDAFVADNAHDIAGYATLLEKHILDANEQERELYAELYDEA